MWNYALLHKWNQPAFLCHGERIQETLFYGERSGTGTQFSGLFTKQERRKWKTVLDSLPVGVALSDNQGKVEFVNTELVSYLPVATPSFTVGQEPMANSTCMDLGLPVDASALENVADGRGIGLKTIIEEFATQTTPERTYSTVHVENKKSYEIKAKQFNEYNIIVVKDQTVYEQLVKEKQLEKYLKMLVSSLTHEIRNPLNVIEGCSSMVTEAATFTETRDISAKLHYSVQYVRYILDSACCLTQTEGGSLAMQNESFSPTKSIECILEMLRPSIEGKDVVLDYEVYGEIPLTICSDRKKYELVLFHLVTNAAKYTSRGSVSVMIRYCTTTSVLTTTVTDTGCGISDEKAANLFVLYGNLSHANSFNPQGMGLGLVLCKRLSKALGGDMQVNSVQGQGSIFTFDLKDRGEDSSRWMTEEEFRPDEYSVRAEDIRFFTYKSFSQIGKHTLAEIPLRQIKEKCECKTTLIVDDEAINRMVIKAYLKELGESAEEAENGWIALQKVQEKAYSLCCRKYKLILMDINMPVMDGTKATEEIKRFLGGTSVPIVAHTAANMSSTEEVSALLNVGFHNICKNLYLLTKTQCKSQQLRRSLQKK
eukprot:TRINITY_DN1186_c0_g1_i1.p1 TRINITY_DN1186_c0_g1~~TRINITY_DN1186_c0_g1_i1.p1  ORF type:complete len:597 (-),score=40.03 TRINITY_DN1186_c0_g1_i1:101-1891(-)